MRISVPIAAGHNHRTSPEITRSTRPAVCISSAPSSSIPAVVPLHDTSRTVPFDARIDRRRRGRTPCAQNIIRPASSKTQVGIGHGDEQLFEQACAIHAPAELGLDRRRATLDVRRMRGPKDVDADADHDRR